MANEIVKTNNEENPMASFIERAATDPNVDIDKFERLIALRNSESERQAKMEYDSAMSNLQYELPTVAERGEISVSNTVRSRYAKFEDINEAIRPHLKTHGFAISFKSNFEDSMLLITGIISHKMGHREETTMKLPFDTSGSKNNVQAIASSVSYGKRYVLCMLLNISTGGEDDDGGSFDTIDIETSAWIKGELQQLKVNVKAFCSYVKCGDVDSMSEKQLPIAKAFIKQKRGSSGNN